MKHAACFLLALLLILLPACSTETLPLPAETTALSQQDAGTGHAIPDIPLIHGTSAAAPALSESQIAASTMPASTAPKTAAATQTPKATAAAQVQTAAAKLQAQEVRGVWLSYFELTLDKGGISKNAFTKQYAAMFDTMAAFGINTLFLHVRPFSDAIYPSALYPWSDILTGTQGKDPGYDPLAILCRLAAARNLEVHAWLNPFRVTRDGNDLNGLAKHHPALSHTEDGWLQQSSNQYFWNPAVPETHALIYQGVQELLRNYPVAGIHIDDYFYPTKDASFDQQQYEAYRSAGGSLALAAWRRELISAFVAGLYRTVKQENPQAVVSISPTANLKQNYSDHYADTAAWLSTPGYCDWMIPQIYFGFDHQTLPFKETALQWSKLPRHDAVKLLFGLAAYKVGLKDAYAGEQGKTEWLLHSDILARQVKYCRKRQGYGGFALYSFRGIFDSSLSDIAVLERKNLQKLLA